MDPNIFSALAEEHRLYIVELLRSGPRTVNEISNKLNINQPQTSKHLRILAGTDLVRAKPHAQQRIYTLNPKKFLELEKWIVSFKKIINKRLDRFDEVLKAQKG